jgi:hypothetical protein
MTTNGPTIFLHPEKSSEQQIVDAILGAIVYSEKEREQLRTDSLIPLLIPNPPGLYNFSIVNAIGVTPKKILAMHFTVIIEESRLLGYNLQRSRSLVIQCYSANDTL